MKSTYKLQYWPSFLKDLSIIRENVSKEKFIKFVNLFNNKKLLLKEFPRIYQKMDFERIKTEEYRRIVLDQYIVVYKIVLNQIIFLKIYPQKINYIKEMKKFRIRT